MKRILASIISAAALLSTATPALAAFNPTRWNQPRVDIRAQKRATIASYQNRWNLAYRRERYNALISQVMRTYPGQLAVTGAGGRTHSDFQISFRPTRRESQTWTLAGHCSVDARKC